MTASGENRSGVWEPGTYRPEGWVGWSRPSEPGFPLPENSPLCLIASCDGEAWFYIGSSGEGHAMIERTELLWFATNDHKPDSGRLTRSSGFTSG